MVLDDWFYSTLIQPLIVSTTECIAMTNARCLVQTSPTTRTALSFFEKKLKILKIFSEFLLTPLAQFQKKCNLSP